MPGLSKVIVLDPDVRAGRQVQLGFEREGLATTAVVAELDGHAAPNGAPGEAGEQGASEQPSDAWTEGLINGLDGGFGLVVIGGHDHAALALVRAARAWLDERQLDVPIMFAGRGVRRTDAEEAGADEVVLRPAYLRDVVTIGRMLCGVPAGQRSRLAGNLGELTGVLSLVRALAALGRSATLTLLRGLRRGEIRFYHGEVTSAQVGMIHGQAALHQLLLWTDARFDFRHEDVVRRQQIPLKPDELFVDAGRFLEEVRDASGGLSPSMVLAQDVARVQSFGKQIPTEVHGVLRMFDGHRTLVDVLEDSAYRVFETLRVAQRAVDAGLLRAGEQEHPRPSWRPLLAIEEWLIGDDREIGEADGDAKLDTSGPVSTEPVREAGAPTARDHRGKGKKHRRKKKRRAATAPVAPATATSPTGVPVIAPIDWGALVPRTVGAEVGPLAGVVPATHVSGEIMAVPSAAGHRLPTHQPTIMLDDVEHAEQAAATEAAAAALVASTEPPPANATIVVDDDLFGDTKRERVRPRAKLVISELAESAAVQPIESGFPSGATTARLSAAPATVGVETSGVTTQKIGRGAGRSKAAGGSEPAAASTEVAGALPDPEPASAAPVTADPATEPTARLTTPSSPMAPVVAPSAAPEPTPSEITDAPSDGIIIHHIATADTAPSGRRRMPSDPPLENDRPTIRTGEITAVTPDHDDDPSRSEPTILVADLGVVHAQVTEVVSAQVTAPISPRAAKSARSRTGGGSRSTDEPRPEGAAFSDVEEAFFRAGHEKDPTGVTAVAKHDESFDDLDEGYRPVGFWDRLRGKQPRRTADTQPGLPLVPPAATSNSQSSDAQSSNSQSSDSESAKSQSSNEPVRAPVTDSRKSPHD